MLFLHDSLPNPRKDDYIFVMPLGTIHAIPNENNLYHNPSANGQLRKQRSINFPLLFLCCSPCILCLDARCTVPEYK